MATLLLMQARGRVTAAEVAEEFEISVATARRDLEALAMAGVPVYPQRGRGGGWSLIGGARTDLTGLTAPEATALFSLAGPSASLSPAVRSALRKLVQALPDTLRAGAEAASQAVVVDATRWGAQERVRSELVDVLRDAVVRRRSVSFDYRARSGERTTRVVDPWGLVDKDEIWYLIAGTEAGQRTFRVDRMDAVVVTDDVAALPDDFELQRAWDRVVGEVEQRRSLLSAFVLIEARLLPVLQDHFGRQCETVAELDDGRVRVRVAAPMARSIAEQLAGWGAMVEVEGPEPVRAELARIGAELTARYG